jgi:hypothetical protein
VVDGGTLPAIQLVEAAVLVDKSHKVEVDILQVLRGSRVTPRRGCLVGFLDVRRALGRLL